MVADAPNEPSPDIVPSPSPKPSAEVPIIEAAIFARAANPRPSRSAAASCTPARARTGGPG
jgi:hypothetical protein